MPSDDRNARVPAPAGALAAVARVCRQGANHRRRSAATRAAVGEQLSAALAKCSCRGALTAACATGREHIGASSASVSAVAAAGTARESSRAGRAAAGTTRTTRAAHGIASVPIWCAARVAAAGRMRSAVDFNGCSPAGTASTAASADTDGNSGIRAYTNRLLGFRVAAATAAGMHNAVVCGYCLTVRTGAATYEEQVDSARPSEVCKRQCTRRQQQDVPVVGGRLANLRPAVIDDLVFARVSKRRDLVVGQRHTLALAACGDGYRCRRAVPAAGAGYHPASGKGDRKCRRPAGIWCRQRRAAAFCRAG